MSRGSRSSGCSAHHVQSHVIMPHNLNHFMMLAAAQRSLGKAHTFQCMPTHSLKCIGNHHANALVDSMPLDTGPSSRMRILATHTTTWSSIAMHMTQR